MPCPECDFLQMVNTVGKHQDFLEDRMQRMHPKITKEKGAFATALQSRQRKGKDKEEGKGTGHIW